MKVKFALRLALLTLTLFYCLADTGADFGIVTAWAEENPLLVAMAAKKISEATSIGQRFLGEELDFDLGVFWFSRAADCVISFQQDKSNSQYVASMLAKTRGFVGWVTGYRENHYVSYMEEVEGGRRLRPLQFERKVIKGNFIHQSIHWFDYQDKRIDYAMIRNHRVVTQGCYDIPEGIVYEDILSAFYNSRAGVFGEVKKGEKYQIPSIPDQGISEYTVEVLNKRREQKQRSRWDWDDNIGVVLKVKVNKEIFGTKEGIIWVWMSKDLIPIMGVAEDAVGLGDVTGRLCRLNYTVP